MIATKKSLAKTFKYASLLLLLIFSQCSGPTEPPKPVEIKDPADYIWTIDTLQYTPHDQTVMNNIWGNTPDNIYIVGHCSNSNGEIWHFNGKSWSVVTLPIAQRSLNGIYGFSSNDIWAVGGKGQNSYDNSYVLHFNGFSWNEIDLNAGQVLITVWGANSEDVWTGGVNNLFHFDGTNWKKVISYDQAYNYQFTSIGGLSKNNVYFINNDIINYPQNIIRRMYHFDGDSIMVVDSTGNVANGGLPKFGALIEVIGGNLYSTATGVFKKVDNNWEIVLNDTRIFRVAGTKSDHIFAGGDGQSIYYYDGSNWQNLIPFPNFNAAIYGIQAFDNEVFILAHDGWKTYVLHGK